MKVYDSNLTGTTAAQAGRSQETQKPDQTDNTRFHQAGSRSEDRVELSSTLGRLSKAMAAYGSSRASQVQALAAQYQAGRYRPDSLATSRGMVSEALNAGTR
jgi:hypothetical protein